MLSPEQLTVRRLEEIAKRLIELEREEASLKREYKELRKAYDMSHVVVEHIPSQRVSTRVTQKKDWFSRLGFDKGE